MTVPDPSPVRDVDRLAETDEWAVDRQPTGMFVLFRGQGVEVAFNDVSRKGHTTYELKNEDWIHAHVRGAVAPVAITNVLDDIRFGRIEA